MAMAKSCSYAKNGSHIDGRTHTVSGTAKIHAKEICRHGILYRFRLRSDRGHRHVQLLILVQYHLSCIGGTELG